MPTDWIPFEEGEYWVEQAYIVAPDGGAVALEKPYIEIAKGPLGKRHLVGKGLVLNLLVVELLEDNDIDEIRRTGDELMRQLSELGASMYEQPTAEAPEAADDGAAPDDEDVVEGEVIE